MKQRGNLYCVSNILALHAQASTHDFQDGQHTGSAGDSNAEEIKSVET